MTFLLNPHRHSASGGAPVIAVTDFSRDKIVFDSGYVFGLDYALVPVTVTASPSNPIEARAWSVDDGGVTSSLWMDIGTTDGAGNLTGLLTPVINRSGYRIEVRLKNAPAVTAQTVNTFRVGHVMAKWGQSEDHRQIETSFSNHAPETLLTLRDQVNRLKTTANLGRTSKVAMKVVGVDALPSGAALVGRSVEVSGTGTLRDWNLVDYELKVLSGADWRATQCRFEETAVGLIFANIRVKPGGRLRYDECSFFGSGKPTSFSAPVVEEQNGAGTIYGKSTGRRCRVEGYPSDALKLVAGSLRWSHLKWKQNCGGLPTLYGAGATYNTGDLVYQNSGGGPIVHKAKVNGLIGVQPPATAGNSDASWQAVNPHVDAATFLNAHETACLEYCYIDFSELVIANGGVGANNFARWQNDDGVGSFAGGTRVRYCVMDRAASNEQPSLPFQMTASFAGNALIEGNWLRPRNSDGEYLYPVNATIGGRITWAGNAHIQTGAAAATPANCVTGAFSAEVNDGMTQVVYHARDQLTNGGANLGSGAAGVRHKFISDSAPHTASCVSIANTFLAERPGEHVCFAFHTLSGTGPSQVFADTTARPWIDDQAIHDYITSGGAKVGIVGSSWYASPIGWGANYGRAWFEAVAGTKTDGSSLGSPRTVLSGTGSDFTGTHLLVDLYTPWDRTKFAVYGPHRFEESVDLIDATHAVGGALNNNLSNIQAIRSSIRSMLTNPLATMFLPQPLDPISYENGHTNGAGGWTDLAHPNDQGADGLARYARLGVHALLQASGLTSYSSPKFDQVTWEASGAYVDVGSSAGPILTTRSARSEAALGNTFTHWTDVAGWQVNGQPADRAELVAGKVRIYPLSGSFAGPDVVMFGEGGGTGTLQSPEDMVNSWWKNMPLVNVGAYGLEGLPMVALPSSAALANTLPGSAYFTNPVGATAHFRDTVNWPTAISGSDRVHQRLTVAIKGKITHPAATAYLCALEGGPNFTIDCTPSGQLRLNVKDSANVSLLTNVGIGTVGNGVYFDLIVTIDINVTNACWTNFNGTITQRPFTASANGICTANRRLRWLASASGAAKISGDFYMLEAWADHVTGGAARPADTFLRTNGRIVGPAATANAHAWKQDAAVFT